jgi:hypothetical protein
MEKREEMNESLTGVYKPKIKNSVGWGETSFAGVRVKKFFSNFFNVLIPALLVLAVNKNK